ncbi:MAG TPA: hypothetical protein PKD98_25645 [Anaerolineae bacterium]|nr:hypothetical protein [Anaerolineae bacterium]
MFRQFFFDLGTFLGEPVEHIWLSPGTTIEMVEVSTRRILGSLYNATIDLPWLSSGDVL